LANSGFHNAVTVAKQGSPLSTKERLNFPSQSIRKFTRTS
jgi:hypothetical protein